MGQLFDESHYFMCAGGMKPARMKTNQNIVNRETGEYYLTECSLRCHGIDFTCRWVALLYALIAAAMAVLLSCPAGWVLLAAIVGAAAGAALGSALCGDMAAIVRIWIVIKTDANINELGFVPNRPGTHLECTAFGQPITYAPNVKNEFTALCMFAGNILTTGLEAFMYVYAFRGAGLFLKAPLTFFRNFGVNYLASLTMKGVAMRSVFGAYSAANTYYMSPVEGGDSEQIKEAALDGFFFMERAAIRIATLDYKDSESGDFNWKGLGTDVAMMFMMGGLPGGKNGDAQKGDVGQMASKLANEWSHPVQTAKAEVGKIIDVAKEFREKIRKLANGEGAHENPFDPTKDPRYEELSTERGKQTKKNINEAEAALQAEHEGKIRKPERPDRSKGEPDLDFKIDGPEPYKYVDIKTPVDPKLRPLETQAADVGKNIKSQKAGSSDVLHIVDLKNIPPESKPAFKQNTIDAAGSSDGIIFINE